MNRTPPEPLTIRDVIAQESLVIGRLLRRLAASVGVLGFLAGAATDIYRDGGVGAADAASFLAYGLIQGLLLYLAMVGCGHFLEWLGDRMNQPDRLQGAPGDNSPCPPEREDEND